MTKENQAIKITLFQNIKLYFENLFVESITQWFCCMRACLDKRKSKLKKLYEEGTDRIEEELDVTRILNKIKTMDLLIKNVLTTKEQRKFAQTHPKRVINLDSEYED